MHHLEKLTCGQAYLRLMALVDADWYIQGGIHKDRSMPRHWADCARDIRRYICDNNGDWDTQLPPGLWVHGGEFRPYGGPDECPDLTNPDVRECWPQLAHVSLPVLPRPGFTRR